MSRSRPNKGMHVRYLIVRDDVRRLKPLTKKRHETTDSDTKATRPPDELVYFYQSIFLPFRVFLCVLRASAVKACWLWHLFLGGVAVFGRFFVGFVTLCESAFPLFPLLHRPPMCRNDLAQPILLT